MDLRSFFRKIKNKIFGKTEDNAFEIQKRELADARHGTLYFLSHTKVEAVPNYSTGLVETIMGDDSILKDLQNASLMLLKSTSAGRRAATAVHDFFHPMVEAVKEFFYFLLDKIRKIFGKFYSVVPWVMKFFRWLANKFASKLVGMIPGWGYVKSATEVYAGLRKAILGAKNFVQQLWSGIGVTLLGGQPSIIANALARHSLSSIAHGIKKVGIAATEIGLEAAGDATAGIGSIITTVTSILTSIAGFIDKYIQRFALNRVIKDAKKAWESKDSTTSMANNHKAFSEWFQNAVIFTPIVAALVVNSGFAGHPYRFLQLIDEKGEVVPQHTYDKGVTYINRLKKNGMAYVKSYQHGYEVTFKGTDGVVKARLKQITSGKQQVIIS
ncbi:Uncharacterised protein [BD1-7 clade bacterium]|uniref:Uncharacterized protein n=1 Tax=BD1-7 clade bacterium TaxID=2029982 RepID=A0A5S9PM92_9GAMM|nr:Uncharacterised protein [BD1-7 clade bacterium]CAA0105254.1 Uncharacterised protein [BD1-7 clade bacterium]